MKLRILKRIWLIVVIIFLFPVELFPADIFVTNTADTGPGSFRDALTQSALTADSDNIIFQIPKTDQGFNATIGVWTIMSTIHYVITDSNLVIHGMSQSDFIGEDTNPFGPEIELKGPGGQGNNGIIIKSSGVHIYYLTINEFGGAGIHLDKAIHCQISGCYIGTDPTGTEAKGNTYGIYVHEGMYNHIVPMDTIPNIISGNPWVGITLGDSSSNNVIVGNIIGLNRTRSDTLGNGLIGGYGGVNISDKSNYNELYDNWIMGNKVGVNINESSHNMIANNFIGTNDTWQLQLGNTGDGITIRTYTDSATNNIIMENFIGYNGWYGITIEGDMAIRNSLTRNFISKNSAMGLINSQGGNINLPKPVIQSVSESQVVGTAGPNMTIEVFEDIDDEGQIFLGSTLSDDSGNFMFQIGDYTPILNITATATDVVGNTSIFSVPYTINTSVDDRGHLPVQFKLNQNYPNPFNSSTTIEFSLVEKGNVEISIFNNKGDFVETLLKEEMLSGYYSVNWNPISQPTGLYFARLMTKNYSAIIKLAYIK